MNHRRHLHPWTALREAERALDRISRRRGPARRVGAAQPVWSPRLEAVETEEGFEVTAEMPGVAREDLEVSVQEGVLTIAGARRFGAPRTAEAAVSDVEEAAVSDVEEAAVSDAEEAAVSDVEEAAVSDAERAVRDAADEDAADENVVRFERRIRFNEDVDEEAIAARYADGVLEVRIPKAAPPEPDVRTIPVEIA